MEKLLFSVALLLAQTLSGGLGGHHQQERWPWFPPDSDIVSSQGGRIVNSVTSSLSVVTVEQKPAKRSLSKTGRLGRHWRQFFVNGKSERR
jgi:hypothetical protein